MQPLFIAKAVKNGGTEYRSRTNGRRYELLPVGLEADGSFSYLVKCNGFAVSYRTFDRAHALREIALDNKI